MPTTETTMSGPEKISEEHAFLSGLIVGGIMGGLAIAALILLLWSADDQTTNEFWQAECIAREVARYNPETAIFEWTVERKAEK